MTAWKQALVFSATVACVLACNVARADHMDMRIVHDYPAGAPAIAQIHAWLLQQPRPSGQTRQMPPPAAADLGTVRVSTVLFDRPVGTRIDAATAAVPLPSQGRPRDEVTIDACNAGQRHRWVYVWQQTPAAAWQLRTYQMKTVADCAAPPDAAMPLTSAAKTP
ncbi:MULTISPECIES: hypothetical protein [Xanthomonas]|uniref:Secreted protein n=1 Tax=Xanthomonas dyei TaxID=743699 RepID=A0ABZ0D9V6_9XANT|nr:hypothetical protein [Xanthomonas dyei]WOB26577.1 hypothetical protein NYR99_00675 [Xanthomonas dyei]WOB54196.1 hypothetical protein NYR95_00675 [Xanthomonas dyei]